MFNFIGAEAASDGCPLEYLDYSAHVETGSGYTQTYTEYYVIGKDDNGYSVYAPCTVTMVYSYCMYKCVACSSRNTARGYHEHCKKK